MDIVAAFVCAHVRLPVAARTVWAPAPSSTEQSDPPIDSPYCDPAVRAPGSVQANVVGWRSLVALNTTRTIPAPSPPGVKLACDSSPDAFDSKLSLANGVAPMLTSRAMSSAPQIDVVASPALSLTVMVLADVALVARFQ